MSLANEFGATASPAGPTVGVMQAAAGHLWTVGGLARRLVAPAPPPPSEPFSVTIDDSISGPQTLTFLLSSAPRSRRLLILVHGLGGSSESAYMAEWAGVASSLGLASLRLNLRGADGDGRDIYHAGLSTDLHAVLTSSRLDGYRSIVLVGLSLGGHLVLRFATEEGDPRVAAVGAVCSPLDLAAGARAIDRPLMAPYRSYLLRGLRAHGERAWRAGNLATPPERLRRVRTLREWDRLTVAPRFGFAGAADYYARASAGPRLAGLRCPALLLAAAGDPMIPPSAIQPAVEAAARPTRLALRWSARGGHLAFPRRAESGAAAGGTPAWVLRWLMQHIPKDD